MANILPFLIVGGAAAYLGLVAGKKAKKGKPSDVPPPAEPADRNIVKSGTSGEWAWRVRIEDMVPGTHYGEILAPGASQWQPIDLAGRDTVDKAKDLALEAIAYAKQLAVAPSGKIVEDGAFHGWGWRVRISDPAALSAVYMSEILAPGTTMWTAAHLDSRIQKGQAIALAKEAIAAARELAVAGA